MNIAIVTILMYSTYFGASVTFASPDSAMLTPIRSAIATMIALRMSFAMNLRVSLPAKKPANITIAT